MTTEETPREVRPEAARHGRGSFGRRIALAFATVAGITALLAAVLLSAVWNYQFDRYVRENLQHVADSVATVAGQAYRAYGGWTFRTLSVIPRLGSLQGVVVQIRNESGELIYDDSRGTEADGQIPISQQQPGEDFAVEPRGPVVTAPIVIGPATVGTVRMWAYGTGAVRSERDEQFRQGSFVALAIAAFVAMIFASMAGLWYARRLVQPIGRITAAAQALREGDRDARANLSGEDEIAVLGATFDGMADAIEADRQLERRLTADVAHELRTPLQAIQATVEAMQDGVLPADEERLGTVRNETVRLARLADAILELTRLERGSLPFDMRPIDVSLPVRAAVDANEALLESCELMLSADIAEGLVVRGDPDRLQQAVGNLISNAARYTPGGGRIEVRVAREGTCALVEVTDTGIGIAEQDLPHVFGRFWRADSARESTTGGLGIGLAVTKEIVDRHRGTIGVESAWGSGARFSIRIPLASA